MAGAGPAFALGLPGDDAADYVRPAELTGITEVRMLPWHRSETPPGIRPHASLTPSYAYGFPDTCSNSAIILVSYEFREALYSRWIGFMLSTTPYPTTGR